MIMDRQCEALLALGRHLRSQSYHFTAITPLSHSRILGRPGADEALTLADVFGWSKPFRKAAPFAEIIELLAAANELEEADGRLRSRVRFATLDGQIYVHSSYPTSEDNAVFFGPDTYRFLRTLRSFMPKISGPFRLVDIGCGSGAGAIHACGLRSGVEAEAVFADINAKALRYSRVNAALNDFAGKAIFVKSDLFEQVPGKADVIISNPPYLVDPKKRAYRHGGEQGFDLSLRIVEESLVRLAPGGRLILYTGTPVVGGTDLFLAALWKRFGRRVQSFVYEEIDPDVFGEELEGEAYRNADRIAVVCVIADQGAEQ
jgi:methylase of polypeptide subunit release factors